MSMQRNGRWSSPRQALAALIFFVPAFCPTAPVTAAEREPVTNANYKQAFHFSNEFLQQFSYDTAVTPHWIGKTDGFWYSYRTSGGTHYWRVDPEKGAKTPLFDQGRLATLLSETVHKPTDANQLPITRVSLNEDGTRLKFVVDDYQYEYDLPHEKISKLGKAPPAPPALPTFPGRALRGDMRRRFQEMQQLQNDYDRQQQANRGRRGQRGRAEQRSRDYRVLSPDKKAYLFVDHHNLYLLESGKPLDATPLPKDKAIQLSTDGEPDRAFGNMGVYGSGMDDGVPPPRAEWSPDSKYFYATRVDGRGVQELFLINSLTLPRPSLETYKYPLPGEEASRRMELYVGDRASHKLIRIATHWPAEVFTDIHWDKDTSELTFTRRDRLWRHGELCRADVRTGKVTSLIQEAIENANVTFEPIHEIRQTNELIWWSERSGWGQFYLYDRDGHLKNPITSGSFRASRVVAVDPERRLLFFQGNSREPGENVYYNHLYCVHLDGNGLVLLDPGDADHQSQLSPSHKFVVDNAGRVDMAPQSVLRDATGREVMKLEEADLSRLYAVGWKMPERFVVKAADGVTDLFGNMWKPFDFDPAKKYPVIAHVYPGPQSEGVTHTFSTLGPDQQLAQLGFIVVQVGHRGGAPERSKAYASYGYHNLRDYGLADKKAAIEELAARFPYLDLDRVGIFGHSGGGFMSAAAVLQKPYNEFFKAAVASSGNHDNNIYNNGWAERYHGMKEVTDETGPSAHTHYDIKVPSNAELAANLKGALLLVHGDLDNNVHPAHTMRLVDALIKANKRFDMLIMPGKRHGYADYQPYFQQRLWDFFADHLLHDRQTGADIYEKQENRSEP
jgi:dipeptidyl-peptidase 4